MILIMILIILITIVTILTTATIIIIIGKGSHSPEKQIPLPSYGTKSLTKEGNALRIKQNSKFM